MTVRQFIGKVSGKLNSLRPRVLRHISYSQTGEDLIIRYIFDSLGIKHPSYLDIGAHHPEHINNTKIFYDHGSHGINIEPDPALFTAFETRRSRDINLNVGVAAKAGNLDFYIMDASSLNTFSQTEAKNYEAQGHKISATREVPVLTLKQILEKYSHAQMPDFITLDVEGLDWEILETMDLSGTKPTVICVETISYSTTGHGKKDERIPKLLANHGYMLYADTNINSIFVKRKAWER